MTEVTINHAIYYLQSLDVTNPDSCGADVLSTTRNASRCTCHDHSPPGKDSRKKRKIYEGCYKKKFNMPIYFAKKITVRSCISAK